VRVVVRGGGAGRRTRLYQALGLFFAAVCVGYLVIPRDVPPRPGSDPDSGHAAAAGHAGDPAVAAARPSPGTAAGAPAPAAIGAAVIPASSRPITPRRMASRRPSQDPPEEAGGQPNTGEITREITAAEYIQALHDAGIYEGIGAFQPPGTSPPLQGLAVPPDFELPEGYVRHFQSTDDGQPIEPILMYSPDYEFFDENGQPIAIPEDRVVPPEYAPPGMPIRTVEIPQPQRREPGDVSR
jgi:hypothetical protein